MEKTVGWFEDRAARRRSVVVLPTVETYYKKYDLYLTLEQYWELEVIEYNGYVNNETSPYHRPMDFSEYMSCGWYRAVEHKARWTDEDYAKTRPYRLWKAEYETAYEQATDPNGVIQYTGRIPVITWPERRRHMVRTYKKTGEK